MIVQILLRDDRDVIAVLGANGENAKLLWCNEAYREDLEDHLQNGIAYPPGTPLAKHNVGAQAPGEDRLAKVADLYADLFALRATSKEMPSATRRAPELEVYLPGKRFGTVAYTAEGDAIAALQNLVVGASFKTWALDDAKHSKALARAEALAELGDDAAGAGLGPADEVPAEGLEVMRAELEQTLTELDELLAPLEQLEHVDWSTRHQPEPEGARPASGSATPLLGLPMERP